MREILFRGKTEKGEWIEGFYVKDVIETYIYDRYRNTRMQSVIPETVGQYTGLTDKNGERVFEGDILEFPDRLVEVFWHAHLGCWDSNFLKYTNKEKDRVDMSPCNWEYNSEVIGNIHDNPELLKGGAE